MRLRGFIRGSLHGAFLLKPRGEKDTFIISLVYGFVTSNQNLYREINFAGGFRKGKGSALASPVPRPPSRSKFLG